MATTESAVKGLDKSERGQGSVCPAWLLPCPFCGSKKVTLWEAKVQDEPPSNKERILWCVFCETCEAEGPHKTTAEVAASGWNTSVGLEAREARVPLRGWFPSTPSGEVID